MIRSEEKLYKGIFLNNMSEIKTNNMLFDILK